MDRCNVHCTCFSKDGKRCCYCHEYPSEEQRLNSYLSSKLKKGSHDRKKEEEDTTDL